MRKLLISLSLACALATGAVAQDTAETIVAATNEIAQMYNEGRYEDALEMAKANLVRAESALGLEHPETLTSMNNLAVLYRATGHFEQAESLYKRALEAREQAFGPEHQDTLASMNNLAVLYGATGRYRQSEPLIKRALEARERLLGLEHPDTLDSVNSLAFLYRATGRHGKAESLYKRALETRERVLGPEHRDTLASMNNLAFLYEITARYSQAEPLFKRALAVSERVLGEEHPQTLNSVSNLAALYRATGHFEQAEPLHKQALEARERVLGPEHSDTIFSMNNLASLYVATGRYGDAEPLYKRAMEAFQRVVGPEHPDTLTSMSNLAHLYWTTRRFDESTELYMRVLKTREMVLGPEHPQTLQSLNDLGALYQTNGAYSKAEQLFKRALEIRERVLGPEHPDTTQSVNNLAVIYRYTERYEEAEALYKRAVETDEKVLGPEHPTTLLSLNNLARLYSATKRYRQAEALYKRVLKVSERALGQEHPNTLGILGSLATLQIRKGEPAAALKHLRQLDQRLDEWLQTEVSTTRAAKMRRQILSLNTLPQDAGFNLAILFPSTASNRFAANLTLRWKKRLAQEDAILNNLARESDDGKLTALVEAVKQGRQALSNVAFDSEVSPQEKTRLREALEADEAALRAASQEFQTELDVRTADFEAVRDKLPENGVLIEYRLFDPYDFETDEYLSTRLLAVILRPDAEPFLVDLDTSEQLFDLQSLVVDTKSREERGRRFDDLMRTAYDRVIAPLLPHLEGARTVYVSPDGPLGAVPFEAFIDGDGQRLIERFDIRMIQTGRDLVRGDDEIVGQGLVALGGIDFGRAPQDAPKLSVDKSLATHELASLDGPLGAQLLRNAIETAKAQIQQVGPLPGSLREVETVSEAYAFYRPDEPAPIILTGQNATEAALTTLPRAPRVLHLASHGYYLESGSIEGRPLLQSGVTLSGANLGLSGALTDADNNGILHAIEAQTLNLRGTELVVLSACDTGQGVFDYSEGFEGLPRAFFVAGARNVLAALWPVGDRAARDFMDRFYEEWLSQNVSDPTAAIRATKLWYINHSDSSVSDPRNWAPFVLFEG